MCVCVSVTSPTPTSSGSTVKPANEGYGVSGKELCGSEFRASFDGATQSTTCMCTCGGFAAFLDSALSRIKSKETSVLESRIMP